jgi:DNA-binding Lrp family transcriptional regulator
MSVDNNTEKINDVILSCLIEDARMSSQEIHKRLKSHGINRTPRAILERINRLEKEGRIAGYTLKAQAKNFEGLAMRIILISFKTSPVFNERVAMFTSYLQNAPFTAFAGRTRGEYDWINVKIFPNTKTANQESDTYRTAFGDIINRYTAYDVTVEKPPQFIQATNYPIEDFYKFCQDWTNNSSFPLRKEYKRSKF